MRKQEQENNKYLHEKDVMWARLEKGRKQGKGTRCKRCGALLVFDQPQIGRGKRPSRGTGEVVCQKCGLIQGYT